MKQFITIEVKSIIMKTSIKTSCLTLAIFNNVNVFCRCSYRDKKNNTNSSRGGEKYHSYNEEHKWQRYNHKR